MASWRAMSAASAFSVAAALVDAALVVAGSFAAFLLVAEQFHPDGAVLDYTSYANASAGTSDNCRRSCPSKSSMLRSEPGW